MGEESRRLRAIHPVHAGADFLGVLQLVFLQPVTGDLGESFVWKTDTDFVPSRR